ncbi:MAG: hypothetical protein H0U89_08610 [Acidimicrobiia bacterium]|nr:hypothetical protein [Acidimicrobiia bacterium]
MNDADGPTVACPTCGGPMSPEASDWFCAVGHRFTAAELTVSQAEAVNRSLWYSLRAIEDRAIANTSMAANLGQEGSDAQAAVLRSQGAEDLDVVKQLHQLIERLEGCEPRIDVEANLKSRTMGSHS